MPTPLTIGVIESKVGTTLVERTTPDGKDLGMYYANCYWINKTTDINKMANQGNIGLVYKDESEYWLASPCVDIDFADSIARFDVRVVSSTEVGMYHIFYSYGRSDGVAFAIRPVVTLSSNVKLTPNADKTEWSIN